MTIIVFVVKPDVEYAVGVRGDNVLAFLEERELGGTAVLRGNTSLTVYGAGAVVDVAARKCGVYEVAVIDVFRLGISLLVSFLALSVSYADYRFRYK